MRLLSIVAFVVLGLASTSAAAQGVDTFETRSDCLKAYHTGCGYLYVVNDCDMVAIKLNNWPLIECLGDKYATRGAETIELADCALGPRRQAEAFIEIGEELTLQYEEDGMLKDFTAEATVACESPPSCHVSTPASGKAPYALFGLVGILGMWLRKRR